MKHLLEIQMSLSVTLVKNKKIHKFIVLKF